jgi:peptidoglycan/xylan/chitin deacetylase (PgdA/CDA1 family)
MRPRLLFLLILSSVCLSHAQRQVAITFDDLPVRQSGATACGYAKLVTFTSRLLKPFSAERIPLAAFVIGSNCPDLSPQQRRTVLRMWTTAGAELGNHTFSHNGLNNMAIEEYEKDILRAEPGIKEAIGDAPLRYFRSPMLQTGTTREGKERLEMFLSENGYQQAPVTFDNSDYAFGTLYSSALEKGDASLTRRVLNAYVPSLSNAP